jgi:hypothetical protein
MYQEVYYEDKKGVFVGTGSRHGIIRTVGVRFFLN